MEHFLPRSVGDDDLWDVADRAGLRPLALAYPDCLIWEKAEAAPLSASTAKALSSLGSLATDDSVLFLDEAHRVEAMVDLNRFAQLQIKDFSHIHSVMLAPKLSHRLGAWTRKTQREDGLWYVSFNHVVVEGETDARMLAVLEDKIIKPWAENRRDDAVPFLRIEGEVVELGARHHRKVADLMIQLKTALEASPESAALYVIVDALERMSVLQADIVRRLQANFGDPVLAAGHHGSTADVVKSTLESATDAVVALSAELSATTTNTAPAAFASDPIQNAIAIRNQITRSVRMVDAATWAKWRGVDSTNPSAALGKYKSQRRLFAVRNGNRDLYPAFQFSENADPLPVIKDVLNVVPDGAQGWPLLSWFDAKNTTLGGQKPSDLVSSNPIAVVNAAERFYSRDD